MLKELESVLETRRFWEPVRVHESMVRLRLSASVASSVDIGPFLWRSDHFGAVGDEFPASALSIPKELRQVLATLRPRCKNHY